MYRLQALIALITLLPLSLALDLVGRIELPSNTTIPASSRVKLDHGINGAWVKADGTFTIEGVSQGTYVVTPFVPGYTVASVLISIIPDTSIDTSTSESVHIQPWHPTKLPNDPTSSPSLPYPFVLYGRQDDYFIPPPGMNVMGLFKSPMVLMMIFSGVMMYAMPKLQESLNDMDPESAQDMAEARKKVEAMKSMDWSGGLSSMLAGTPAAEAPARAGTPSGGKKKKGK